MCEPYAGRPAGQIVAPIVPIVRAICRLSKHPTASCGCSYPVTELKCSASHFEGVSTLIPRAGLQAWSACTIGRICANDDEGKLRDTTPDGSVWLHLLKSMVAARGLSVRGHNLSYNARGSGASADRDPPAPVCQLQLAATTAGRPLVESFSIGIFTRLRGSHGNRPSSLRLADRREAATVLHSGAMQPHRISSEAKESQHCPSSRAFRTMQPYGTP